MRNDAGINGDAQRIEQIAWMLFLKVYDAKEQDWEINDDNYESIIPEKCRWINWAHDDRSGLVMTGDNLLNFERDVAVLVLDIAEYHHQRSLLICVSVTDFLNLCNSSSIQLCHVEPT